jgi:hypothetical protein
MQLISSSPFLCFFLIPTLVVSPLAAQSPVITSAPTLSGSATTQAHGSALDNTDLQLRVVEGGATEAKVNSTLTKGLSVAVTTASGAAVADAAVALRLPDSGATGAFADGSHAAVAYTDATGQAHFAGLHWGQLPGPVAMRLTATKGTSHAALLLNETLTSDVTTVVQVPSATVQAPQSVLQPGQPAASQPIAKTGASPAILSPASPAVSPAPKPEPTVSVTGASPDASQHSSKTKWIIIAAAVAAAAGAGIALRGKGKSNPASTTNSLTVGTPSVSVGAP